MKGLVKITVCVASGLLLNVSLRAGSVPTDNPYGTIVARNVFGLNPPGPAAPVVEGDPPPKITPNGIMSIFGQLQVLFKVAPKPNQPGAKEESYVLSEGQQQDDIEVTHIDEKAGLITFNNHGTVQEIPLANTPASGPTAPAGTPSVPNFPMPNGGNIPSRFGGGRPFGGPGGRLGGQGRADNPNNGLNGLGGGPTLNTIPTRGGYTPQTTAPQPQNNLTAEEQMVVVAAQHLKAQQEGNPASIIFPPTPFDAEAGINNNSGPPTPGQ
jgi:hypothetical protein